MGVDIEVIASQQPLINLHLPLVRDLPGGIEIDLPLFCGGLVINDNVAPIVADPQIVYGAGYDQIGVTMVCAPSAPMRQLSGIE